MPRAARATMTLMPFSPPPLSAAWRHEDARDGFEVVCFHAADDGYRIDGCTTAVEDSQVWAVTYAITVDSAWTTRSARITGLSTAGTRQVLLEADGAGHWLIDGAPAAHLHGCLDVDLESSAVTNALPVHRLGLLPGGKASSPAAYVRAGDLAVERLEQSYASAGNRDSRSYDYAAPSFDFACRLVYDESGLVIDYPGIAVRVR
jgi:hypothetical protein